MNDLIGYVVVEYNQASGAPSVSSYSGYGGDLYPDRAEAEDILQVTRVEMKHVGRLETYALAEVRLVDRP